MTSIDQSQVRYARLAGIMYLLVDAAYAVGLFIASRFHVPGNFAETAHRIMTSEQLYRIGLSSLLVSALCTVFLAMGLYVAVKPINRNLALLAFAFRLAEAILFGVQAFLGFAALNLYIGADRVNSFNANQLSALAYLRSASLLAGFNIAAIFFGIGSILFFYLFFTSTYIPKFLSGLGLFGSVLVPIVCFGSLISPQHGKLLQLGWLPIGLAEILVGFCLLLKKVNVQQDESRNAVAVSAVK